MTDTMYVQGNMGRMLPNGRQSVYASVPAGPITIEFCRQFAREHGCQSVSVHRTDCYLHGRRLAEAEWPEDEYNDGHKWVRTVGHYDPKCDSLTISENGKLIYANDGGVVCRDLVALADSVDC